jgi:hypothetical protein
VEEFALFWKTHSAAAATFKDGTNNPQSSPVGQSSLLIATGPTRFRRITTFAFPPDFPLAEIQLLGWFLDIAQAHP